QRHIAGGGHYKGVIEKCTFCAQRVEKGLLPACSDSCPTHAIIFGDLDDPGSEVSTYLKENLHFRLLEDIGTRPRVYYVGGKPPGLETRQTELPMRRVEQ
ncbi:MAG: hypothetical protein LN412_04625, partial [Candidatus Thermoplasmatota archaeon]|nr:hypothetical protein [Candidatus Thermoplasmatota archaeon]